MEKEQIRQELEDLKKQMLVINERIDYLTNSLDISETISLQKEQKDVIVENIPLRPIPIINSNQKGIEEKGRKQVNKDEPFSLPSSSGTPLMPETNKSFTPLNSFVEKGPNRTNKGTRDIESNLGKNVMGIAAALLMFIGVASFAILLINNVSEFGKFLLMYLFSAGLFGIGFLLVNRKKNTFSLSLMGSGVGCIFISILLTYFYFDFITQITLFILMLVWVGFVYKLCDFVESSMFLIVSYLGFVIALIIGSLSEYAENPLLMGFLFILFSGYSWLSIRKSKQISLKCVNALSVITLIHCLVLAGIASAKMSKLFEYFTTIPEIFYVLCILCVVGFNFYLLLDFKNRLKQYSGVVFGIILIGVFFVNTLSILSFGGNIVRDRYHEPTPILSSILEVPDNYNENRLEFEAKYYSEHKSSYTNKDYHADINLAAVTRPVTEFIPSFILLSMLIHFIVLEYFEVREKFRTSGNVLYYLFTFIICLCLMDNSIFETVIKLTGFLIISGGLLGYSYKKQDKTLLNISIILACLGSMCNTSYLTLLYLYQFSFVGFLVLLFHLVYLVLVGIVLKNQYSRGTKILYYFSIYICLMPFVGKIGDYLGSIISGRYILSPNKLSLIWNEVSNQDIYYSFWYSLDGILNFVIFSFFTIFVIKSMFCQDWREYENAPLCLKDKELPVDILNIINRVIMFILMGIGIYYAYDIEEVEIVKLLVVILSSVLCFMGSSDLVRNKSNNFVGYYVGIKSTIFIMCILDSYLNGYDMSYIYSVICLILAVISICLGFWWNYKSFRMYGLLLSLFSVVKLVLIDLTYTNSMSRIFSFIVSGAICYGIVWLYNKMSENIKENFDNLLDK